MLDSLRNGGMNLDRHYGSRFCAPTRAMLLTYVFPSCFSLFFLTYLILVEFIHGGWCVTRCFLCHLHLHVLYIGVGGFLCVYHKLTKFSLQGDENLNPVWSLRCASGQDRELLPATLKRTGDYDTFGVGKWHLGHYR